MATPSLDWGAEADEEEKQVTAKVWIEISNFLILVFMIGYWKHWKKCNQRFLSSKLIFTFTYNVFFMIVYQNFVHLLK